MIAKAKVALVLSAAAALVLLSSTQSAARPWRCVAGSNVPNGGAGRTEEIATGPTQEAASQRALAECHRRGPKNCYIAFCREAGR
jgi:hypothetical protein